MTDLLKPIRQGEIYQQRVQGGYVFKPAPYDGLVVGTEGVVPTEQAVELLERLRDGKPKRK